MASQSDLSVRAMCCVLGVSVSGSYAWRDRTPSQRNIANAVMTERIRQIHLDSYESYGMPRGVPSSWNKANASAASVWRSSCAKPVSRASASAEASRLPPAATAA